MENPFSIVALVLLGLLFYLVAKSSLQRRAYQKRKEEYQSTLYAQKTKNSLEDALYDDGTNGEYLLGLELEKHDSKGMFLFNLYIPKRSGGYVEIDAIYIAKTGLYVFESKRYKGWIFGSVTDKTWCQTFKNGAKHHFYNPIKQNEQHINVLTSLTRHPRSHFVSIIVFSESCKLVKVPQVPYIVIYRKQVVETLQNLESSRLEIFSEEQVQNAYRWFEQFSNASDEIKESHKADALLAKAAGRYF